MGSAASVFEDQEFLRKVLALKELDSNEIDHYFTEDEMIEISKKLDILLDSLDMSHLIETLNGFSSIIICLKMKLTAITSILGLESNNSEDNNVRENNHHKHENEYDHDPDGSNGDNTNTRDEDREGKEDEDIDNLPPRVYYLRLPQNKNHLKQSSYLPRRLLLPEYLVNVVLTDKGDLLSVRSEDRRPLIVSYERVNSITTRGFRSGITRSNELAIRTDLSKFVQDFQHEQLEMQICDFPCVDVNRSLLNYERSGSNEEGICKEDFIMAPEGTTADCIASWRWDIDIQKGCLHSLNLVNILQQARSKGYQTILIDYLSIDQNSPMKMKLIVEYGKIYSCLSVIRNYELLQLLDSDFNLNDFIRPWIYIEVSRYILNCTFEELNSSVSSANHSSQKEFSTFIKFRFLIEVLNLSPKIDKLTQQEYLKYGIHVSYDDDNDNDGDEAERRGINYKYDNYHFFKIPLDELEEATYQLNKLRIGTFFRQPNTHASQWAATAALACFGTLSFATCLSDLGIIRLLLSSLLVEYPPFEEMILPEWREYGRQLVWYNKDNNNRPNLEDRLQVALALHLLNSLENKLQTQNYYLASIDIIDIMTYNNITMNFDIPNYLKEDQFVGFIYQAPNCTCYEIFRGYSLNVMLHVVFIKKEYREGGILIDFRPGIFRHLVKKGFPLTVRVLDPVSDELMEFADDQFYQILCKRVQ